MAGTNNNYRLLFLTVTALLQISTAYFLGTPSVRWTYQLPGSGSLSGRSLRQHNEVLVSKNGSTIFATADDGSLHFIYPDNLRNSFVFEPEIVRGTYTECRSGVAFVEENGEFKYVVYAVMDVPVTAGVQYDNVQVDSSRTSTLSRLLAVNLDGSLRWSIPFNGVIVGKAIVGGADEELYVVHNVPNNIGSSPTRGKVSVVLLGGSSPVVTAAVSPLNRYGPFGPATGTTVTIGGKKRDILVVAEAWDNGYTEDGQAYFFMPSSLHDQFSGQGNDAYELRVISDWKYSSVSRAALKKDGTAVYLGGTGAHLDGWTSLDGVLQGQEQGVNPAWDISLDHSKANASQPLLVAPILSMDQSTLYQVGASTELYCIDAGSGTMLWENVAGQGSVVLTEPRLVEFSNDESKVFVIESMQGRVRQHDAASGNLDWQFDCGDVFGGPCQNAVESDFSVSPTNNVLYYGDIFGQIVALDIATFPTSSPSNAQTDSPTGGGNTAATGEKPTSSPTFSPKDVVINTGAPQANQGTSAPVKGTSDNQGVDVGTSAAAAGNDKGAGSFFSNQMIVILVAVCGGLAFVIALVLFAQKVRNTKKPKMSKDGATAEDDGKWGGALDEYKEQCRNDEEEILRKIVSDTPTSPSKTLSSKESSSKANKKKHSPQTPSTLATVEESPAECDLSFVSDSSPKRNLEKSFDASYTHPDVPTPENAKAAVAPNMDPMSQDEEKKDDDSKVISENNDPGGPPELSSVEVMKSSVLLSPQSPVRTVASSQHNHDDGFSVDGSLYLDDDSLVQGHVEVASLAQYSYASTKEEIETSLAGDYPVDENTVLFEPANEDAEAPRARYVEPPKEEAPVLSPQIAEYLRRNQASMSPNPMTPKENEVAPRSQASLISTSPLTPPSGRNSPQEAARAGQSVRKGASSSSRGRSQTTVSGKDNRVRSTPTPEPPVQSEEPQDAWASFLQELAKAEQDFFNPPFKTPTTAQTQRDSSPPPPPPPLPPTHSPPESPGCVHPPPRDPPVESSRQYF